MLTSFWEEVASRLADRWASAVTPALLFWVGGMLALVWERGGTSGVAEPADWIARLPWPVQAAVLVAALAIVLTSALVVRRLITPVLRLLEGYWPSPLEPVRQRLVARHAARAAKLQDAWSNLAPGIDEDTASPQERAEYVRLDRRLRRMPDRPADIMPSHLGNILRAGESRPFTKYGLDPVKCWPHLWLLLPEQVRDELTAARASLDAAVASFLWGLLFLTWIPWTAWAAVLGIVVSGAAYRFWIPNRAEVFADLVEAAFDLHRRRLYDALRWPLPADPADEFATGPLLTTYLWRGSDAATPTFTAGGEATVD